MSAARPRCVLVAASLVATTYPAWAEGQPPAVPTEPAQAGSAIDKVGHGVIFGGGPTDGGEVEGLPSASPSPPLAVAPRSEWYGWQTALADIAPIVLTTAGFMGTKVCTAACGHDWSAPLLGAGVGTCVLGAPIVHAAHGRWKRGIADAGMRLGIPMVTGLIGYGIG